jgi:CBS-domain-containing membrane protein
MAEMALSLAELTPVGIDLPDDDLVGAMREIPGYIDVTVADLREIFRRAYPRAVERKVRGLRAGDLMRPATGALRPEMAAIDGAALLAAQGVQSLPVVDDAGCVVGVFSEADFARRLNGATALEVLLRLLRTPGTVDPAVRSLPVSDAMRPPVVTVTESAGASAMLAALARQPGGCIPVTTADGRLCGVLRRQDLAYALARLAG